MRLNFFVFYLQVLEKRDPYQSPICLFLSYFLQPSCNLVVRQLWLDANKNSNEIYILDNKSKH